MEIVSGVYKITNIINQKIYIGSSVNIYKRWRNHITDLNRGCHCNKYLQKAWNIYGESNFVFEILEVVDDKKIIKNVEQTYLDKLSPFNDNGYNLCKDTSSYHFGISRTEEYKEKMKNRKYTNEHKEKISMSNPNRKEIFKISLSGEILEKYHSLRTAAKENNVSSGGISRSIKNNGSCGGYIWEFVDEYNSKHINYLLNKINNGIQKPVVGISKDFEDVIFFDSAKKACVSIGGKSPSCISGCCNKNRKTPISAYGYYWLHYDDYIKNKNNLINYLLYIHKK